MTLSDAHFYQQKDPAHFDDDITSYIPPLGSLLELQYLHSLAKSDLEVCATLLSWGQRLNDCSDIPKTSDPIDFTILPRAYQFPATPRPFPTLPLVS